MADGKVCRICLRVKRVLLSIFNATRKDDIDRKIMKCANVNVEIGDGLPKHICLDCLTLLLSAVIFKDTCERSDQELRSLADKRIKEEPDCYSDERESTDQESSHGDHWTEIEVKEDLIRTDQLSQDSFDALTSLPTVAESTILVEAPPMSKMIIRRKGRTAGKSNDLDKTLRLKKDGHRQRRRRASENIVCSVCGRRLANINSLKNHMLIHTGELPFQCPLCPHRSRLECSLKVHMRIHSGERPYSCPQCPQTFTTASNRLKHLHGHQNLKPYKCRLCTKAYSGKRSLNDHMVVMHKMESETHTCNICEKQFRTRRHLLKHKLFKHKIKTKRKFNNQQCNESESSNT